MRALIESFERESDLHRQLRTVKEQLVTSVLRLQISARMSEADELTITTLRNEVAEAKRRAMVSDKQSSTASSLIQQLNNEISSLKKNLREAHLVNLANPNLTSDAANGNLIAAADNEVEQMVYRAATPHTSNVLANALSQPESLTPFQQWKVDKFLWSPDTPAGSAGFDKSKNEAFALNDTFMRDFASFSLQRPTQSRLAKLRTTSPKSRERHPLASSVSFPLPSLHMSGEHQARLMGLVSGVSSSESLNFGDAWEGELAGSESLYPMPTLEDHQRRTHKMRLQVKENSSQPQPQTGLRSQSRQGPAPDPSSSNYGFSRGPSNRNLQSTTRPLSRGGGGGGSSPNKSAAAMRKTETLDPQERRSSSPMHKQSRSNTMPSTVDSKPPPRKITIV